MLPCSIEAAKLTFKSNHDKVCKLRNMISYLLITPTQLLGCKIKEWLKIHRVGRWWITGRLHDYIFNTPIF